ncbi:anti-sigma regulatory factor [Mycolicibacterium mucogenicum]|uniref:Anti-sigma regulatory factor n=1 Tax=Mycolicibacterium mucogenicum TaxID=56689 RepID=A0A1A3GK29_MYCMU|nr:ATP-binding protein [Mycolicibacterium mucogenicum]OBJ35663.1 anti-sigma regulatory factor [Mycolicibacterium mucogenicum]
MTEPDQSSSGARFSKTDVVAIPEHAASIRQEFSTWLTGHFALDRIKASDIVLAVNEALANAVEAAYADAPAPGVMHVRADFDRQSGLLTVTVTDEGRWRPATAQVANSARGRGIPLMQALTDHASIEPSDAGTQVRLQWDAVEAAVADAAGGG